MSAEKGRQERSPEVADVNHYDSRVFVRFVDGRNVLLTGEQILQAAQVCETAAPNLSEDEIYDRNMQSP